MLIAAMIKPHEDEQDCVGSRTENNWDGTYEDDYACAG